MTGSSKGPTKRPPSTVDLTTAAPRVESTGASIFAGASSTSVLGGEVSNSQRDQNRATIIINVGGSDSDSSRATSAVSKARTSDFARDAPDASTSSVSDEEQGSILEESSVSTYSGLGSSETSFEIKSSPTEEEKALKEEPGNTIYERHMCLKKHGFPLWTPRPNMTLPHSYQRQGVSIGDVGIFTLDGGFDFLFNICLPAGHPSNPDELPEGFSYLDLKPADVCKSRAHSSHTYMSSPSVRRKGKAMAFECSDSEGAILTMPQGAYHEDLRNIKRFRDYAAIHAESWYQYANGPCGREIGNAELHLVTGCDKTTSWGIATYSHRQSKHIEDHVTQLSFNVSNEGRHPYPTFAWDQEGDAEVKAGPEHEELMDPPEVHALAPLRNQCTFVRSLTPALGDDDWERLQSKVAASGEARASLEPLPKNPFVSVLGAISSLPGRIGSLGGHSRVGTFRLTDSLTSAQTLAAHPATFVIDMLLRKCPKAKVVIVHDDDWCSVIQDSDNDWLSTCQDLQRGIQEAFDIVEEENGTIYLQEKAGPSQQPSTSSHVSVKLEEENFALLGEPGFSQPFDSFEISPSDVKADSPDTSEASRKSQADWNDTLYIPTPPEFMSQQSGIGLSEFTAFLENYDPNFPRNSTIPELNIPCHSLLHEMPGKYALDAPSQPEKYASPSETPRKEIPAIFTHKRVRSQAFGEDEDEFAGEEPLAPDATEEEQIAWRRRQNTLAARKSRKRKLQHQQELKESLEKLAQENEA